MRGDASTMTVLSPANVDEALDSYERGAALKRHCEAKLKEAQQKVDRIVAASDGSLSVEPADEG